MFASGSRYTRLGDGRTVRLRAVRPTDDALIADGFSRMSPASRYARFFTPLRELPPEMLHYFTHVDAEDHVAIVAVTPDGKTGLGVARFVRDRIDPQSAEVAVSIVDDAQHLGLGQRLIAMLADEARAHGIRVFTAGVQVANAKMRGLLKKLGAEYTGGEGPISRHRWRV
jgi:RimJ/RimL family protein N-acetyltransferase